jgi:predicted HD phosphohydrolase
MTVDDVLALLESGAGRFNDGEPVDEREHALQCAHLAASEGADDDLVVAAALHDIGYHPEVKARFPDMPHESSGAAFAADVCGARAAWLIAQHVPAKRYLVATDPAYTATLSDASVRSLARQGGPMSSNDVAAFESQPWSADAARLRKWDDLAKVPGAASMSTDKLRPILSRVIARSVEQKVV